MLRKPRTLEDAAIKNYTTESTKATAYLEELYNEAHAKYNQNILVAKSWQALANQRIKYEEHVKYISSAFEQSHMAAEDLMQKIDLTQTVIESTIFNTEKMFSTVISQHFAEKAVHKTWKKWDVSNAERRHEIGRF